MSVSGCWSSLCATPTAPHQTLQPPHLPLCPYPDYGVSPLQVHVHKNSTLMSRYQDPDWIATSVMACLHNYVEIQNTGQCIDPLQAIIPIICLS